MPLRELWSVASAACKARSLVQMGGQLVGPPKGGGRGGPLHVSRWALKPKLKWALQPSGALRTLAAPLRAGLAAAGAARATVGDQLVSRAAADGALGAPPSVSARLAESVARAGGTARAFEMGQGSMDLRARQGRVLAGGRHSKRAVAATVARPAARSPIPRLQQRAPVGWAGRAASAVDFLHTIPSGSAAMGHRGGGERAEARR